MQTDPIADFITKIRNAVRARHHRVEDSYSKMREALARILMEEGFFDWVEVQGQGPHRQIVAGIRYTATNEPVLRGIKRVSKPSVRVYVGAKEIPKVQSGLGISILSTPAGILTDREARKRNVGGELLISVW